MEGDCSTVLFFSEKKEMCSELVKVCKGMKLSGWACLVICCTVRRRSFVSTEKKPHVILNSVFSLISARRCSSGLPFKSVSISVTLDVLRNLRKVHLVALRWTISIKYSTHCGRTRPL